MDFIALATKAQKELDGEIARLKTYEDQLNIKASALASKTEQVEKREGELNAKEKQLQAREEGVSMRELTVRRDTDVQKDLDTAISLNREAVEERRKAQEYRDDAKMKLEDLERREVALSEREKTYKQEIELEVMRNFTFRK